jgi:hypothetical protein
MTATETPELAGWVTEHDITYHHVVVTHEGANYRCVHHHLSPAAAGDCLARIRRTFRHTGHLPSDLRRIGT